MHQHEAGSGIVVLLGDDTIETDCAVLQVVHAGLPEAIAEPLPTLIRLDNVEPEEPECAGVAHDRDAADGLSIKTAHQEPCWIGSLEALRILEARVPALGCRPVDCLIEIRAIHDTDSEGVGARVCHSPPRQALRLIKEPAPLTRQEMTTHKTTL